MKIEENDVVLITSDNMWDGCLLKVEEVRSWGVIGAVVGPQGTYPLRLPTSEIAVVYRRIDQ